MPFTEQFLDDLRARVPVSAVASAKVTLRREGNEFVGLSPFQQEKTPSFKVNDAKGFYHDFSSGRHGDVFAFLVETEGCTFPEAVERVAQIAGVAVPEGDASKISKPNARPEKPKPTATSNGAAAGHANSPSSASASSPTRTIAATYDYTDPQGALLYQVVRFEPKGFAQRRPVRANDNPSKIRDGWVWNLDGIEHGLYRALELREVAGPDDFVFIPEGEKDADTLWGWGLPATTNSGGARNWRGDHAEFFRDRRVVIPLDNDTPGRERGELIAKSLHGIAREVRLLDFAAVWPNAPKGADVTDWVRQREGTPEDLMEIVASLPVWTPPAVPFVSKFGGLPFEDLDAPGPEHEYLIDGWLTVGDKSIIGGPSKSGKSFLAIHAAMCTALGIPFFGRNVMAPGLVVYQAGEGARGVKKRFRAWRQHFGVSKAGCVPVYVLQAKIDLYRPDGDVPGLIEEIMGVQRLYDVPLRALFIDTLATATGGADENSGKDMSTVMANVDRLVLSCPGCHVCLVHHFNAAGTKLRGHSSIYNNIDQVILVTKQEGTKARTAVLDKQKDGEDGAEIKFELLPIEIGFRAVDGQPITSCVTMPLGGAAVGRRQADVPSIKLTNDRAIILSALKEALAEFGERTPAVLRLPHSIRTVVNVRRWKEVYLQKCPDPDASDNTINKRLRDASAQFQHLHIIGRLNPWVWVTGRGVAGVIETTEEATETTAAKAPTETEPLPHDIGDLM